MQHRKWKRRYNQRTNSQKESAEKESAVGGHCESATAEVNTSRNRCALHDTLLFGENFSTVCQKWNKKHTFHNMINRNLISLLHL